MKITKVNLPENFAPQNGLYGIEMHRLGQLVLLAGRNGSGKSRLLEKISHAFKNQPTPERINQIRSEIQQHETNLRNQKDQLKNWENPSFNPASKGQQRENQINQAKRNKDHFEGLLKNLNSEMGRIVFEIEHDSDSRKIVHFIPKRLDLSDPKSLKESERETRAKNAHSLGVDNLHEFSLCKIQELHTQFWYATHQNSPRPKDEIDAISEEYERLQLTIQELLGVNLGSNVRGDATLFDFPIGQARLSDGQKVLLQLAVAIHCQGNQLSETILLLDEPENHIHPGAIIEVLETLIEKIPKGQIWLATHSVSILAHFAEQGNLWYMDEGRISPAGKIQEKVLQGLLGDETRIARQMEFLQKPERVALTKYAQQCGSSLFQVG